MSDRATSFGSGRATSFDLRRVVKRWVDDGRAQNHSEHTMQDRLRTMERFCWWLENEAETAATLDAIDPPTIRAFLAYLREPDRTRWGSDHPSSCRAMKPASLNAYYRVLRAFGNWCVEEGLLEADYRRNVKAPKVPKDQIQPLSPEQIRSLVQGARGSQAPDRDAAIIILLYDTGLRVSELCSLTVGDVDRGEGALRVTGKGGKRRTVYMAKASRSALWRYLERERGNDLADRPLFVSVGGRLRGQGMTRSGVHQAIADAGRRAGIEGVRVSPHTLRHSFAISFLRNGGNVYELQSIMGHEDLTILRRYVAIAEQDCAEAHRRASPADRLKLR